MSRHALRHRATKPLTDSAWPLYVKLCALNRRAANRFEFVLWITARTRPLTLRGLELERLKAEVLAGIEREIRTHEAAAAAVAGLSLMAAE